MIYDEGLGDTSFKQEYGYTLSALGSSYRYLGQYDKAERYLKEALKIFRAADSPSGLRVNNNDDHDDNNKNKLYSNINYIRNIQKNIFIFSSKHGEINVL